MFLAKEKLIIVCKIIVRVIRIIILLCGFAYTLCFVNLHEQIRKLSVYTMLRTNLDFLSAVVSRYGELFLALLFLLLCVYLICNYRTSINDFTLAGFSFTLKDPGRIIRVKVSNYLNTKRSLFYYYEAYDNLYDVMSSWHEILLYIREQLLYLEDSKISV